MPICSYKAENCPAKSEDVGQRDEVSIAPQASVTVLKAHSYFSRHFGQYVSDPLGFRGLVASHGRYCNEFLSIG